MNKRILDLRKALSLSQEKFGEKLGVSGAAVSRMESGTYNITETMIKLICSTYNVNEVWLRTGVGEIFNESADDELAWLIGVLYAEGDKFKKNFIIEMMKLDSDQWEEIKKFIRKLARVAD